MRFEQMPRIMGGYDPCVDGYAKAFYNRADVQKALHVSDGRVLKNWTICKYAPEALPGYRFLLFRKFEQEKLFEKKSVESTFGQSLDR